MNAAFDGDTVIVYPGTYNEDVNFETKSITLGSLNLENTTSSFVENTIINGQVLVTSVDNPGAIVGLSISGSGHGIYVTQNTNGFLIKDVNIRDNESSGILAYDSHFLIEQSRISNHNYSGYGAGANINNSNVHFVNCYIDINSSSSYGGGLYVNNSNVLIDNSTFYDNYTNGSGGGLYVGNNSDILIKNGIFRKNRSYNGGGLATSNSKIVLSQSIIDSNYSSSHGGGIQFGTSDSDTAFFDDLEIIANTSSSSGGGISKSGNYYLLYMNSTKILNNISNASGGGMYLDGNNANDKYNNILVAKNITNGGLGGGFYFNGRK